MDDNPVQVAMDNSSTEVVMDEDDSEVNKFVVSGHYDLSRSCVKAQSHINTLSAYLLGLSNKDKQVNKGIKVSPGDKFEFHYAPKERPNLYVFEAGVDPEHAATIMKAIEIYVIWDEKKTLLATLSSTHPKVQLDLMMSQGMQLSHTSLKKTVYFNACEFKTMPLHKDPKSLYKDSAFRTDKEIWVMKVKPQEEVILNSRNDLKYHLLRVFLVDDVAEDIDLYIKHGEKVDKIGILPKDQTFYCNLEFEDEFSVLHSSKVADVIFYGYTVPNLFTVELPGPPNTEINIKGKPLKECDDPEYKIFVAKRMKGGVVRHKEQKLISIMLVPLPLIRGRGHGPLYCNARW